MTKKTLAAAAQRAVVAFALTTLLVRAAFAEGPSTQDELTPAQVEQVETLIHDYILAHPDTVFAALKQQQEAIEAARRSSRNETIAARQRELLDDPTSPIGGNPEGDVTIVEFFDYRCPYCKAIEPSLEALLKEDGKLRIVYKEFPILGKVSVDAAEMALAAQQQGKYTAFHDAMMATKGNIDDAAVRQVARLTGIDLTAAEAATATAETNAIIKANYALAAALGITGTPGIVIGSEIADGAADLDRLRRMIANARRAE